MALWLLSTLVLLAHSYPNRFATTDLKPECEFAPQPMERDCLGSWVTTAVSSFAARRCYQLDDPTALSLQDAVNCVTGACGGGMAAQAWKFLNTSGVANYTCVPDGKHKLLDADSCRSRCNDDSHKVHYQVSGYRRYLGVPSIQMAILQGGPVQACMEIYRDFYSYVPGTVYAHYWGGYDRYACVQLIGWEGSAWLAFNHWLEDWGDNGKFLIQMGACGIENEVWGADL